MTEGFREEMLKSGLGVNAYGKGFYLTERYSHARKFGTVIAVWVTMQNPYTDKDFKRRFKHFILTGQSDTITEILRGEGYDGIVIDADKICVFDAENIEVI